MAAESACPGCRLRMPADDSVVYEGYFNAKPECWSVFTEVVGREFSDAILFGQVHQLTVDAYAVQHPGGPHPDKSIDIHLAGLHLVLERGMRPTSVPRLFQRFADGVAEWPHFPPPAERGELTVLQVALADSPEDHAETVERWAGSVWEAWSPHHGAVEQFVTSHLGEGD